MIRLAEGKFTLPSIGLDVNGLAYQVQFIPAADLDQDRFEPHFLFLTFRRRIAAAINRATHSTRSVAAIP